MRLKRPMIVLILLLFVLGQIRLQAQNIYVVKNNGTQTIFSLSNLRKIAFSPGNVSIQKVDNTTGQYALSELQYLSFSDFKTGNDIQVIQTGTADLLAYPNPATGYLNVIITSKYNKEGSICILALDGKLMQLQVTKGSGMETIDLSQLPQGIFICRYSNSKEIKTVKFIKQ